MGVEFEYECIAEIRLDRLQMGSSQARTREVETDIEELAENIKKNNLLEPISVMRAEDNSAPIDEYKGKYFVIAGQRRVLAYRRLGKTKIAAMVMRGRIDESTAKALSVSENLIRKDLSDKDLIDACTQFFRKYGSVSAVAEELGLPEYRVRAYVKYERLSGDLKRAVNDGRVDMEVALQAEDLHAFDKDGVDALEEAKKLRAMTKAQRRQYVKVKKQQRPRDAVAAADVADPADVDIRQTVVSLRAKYHTCLKEWSRAQSITMDEGAARIIEGFFDGRGRRVSITR